ncbi:xylitol oxidase [Jatrophihabitans sp. GAS493]|uniref:D-arabinono-1,4-lactone oxidase n=1 Tax=Jatrophihabitans sp. GAS493 TaxID=1907575 RepID=UPI000BB6BD4C|nr:D-arabinono-1,4-lactone oxidase [Jatrophihabitans sp. GAS493]SOD70975.1 xylitol oxidase [Jatrophihabitans sp. GAS493]
MPYNWARNVRFTPSDVQRPASLAELQSLVARADRAHALGSGHSFNRLADTTGELISVADLPQFIAIDESTMTVSTSAGIRYGALGAHLHGRGFALRNLASLPHISVAGAVATATHGSGVTNGNLASAVRAQELVLADGSIRTISRSDAEFNATVVGLGALGIVTTLTLEIVDTFDVRQYVYDDLPFPTFYEQTETILGAAYSVSLFTDWQSRRFNNVWLKRLADDVVPDPTSWMGAALADGPRHPVPGADPRACSQQGGVAGPWHERLPHFRLEFTPSNGDELQSEYLLPRALTRPAVQALEAIAPQIAPALMICEIRTVAADELWLSTSYGTDSCALHFTWRPDAEAVAVAVRAIEAALEPFAPRPHWGKVFSLPPATLAGRYGRFADFQRVRREYDPAGKFGNDTLDHLLG